MPIGSSTVSITPSLLLNHKCFVVAAKKFTGKLRKYLRFKMGKYRRKTNKASWTSSQLTEAMQAIENKEMTMRGAAKKYGIPVMTLSDRFKTKNVKAPRLGRKTILSEKCEVELESFLMEMQNIFCGVTQLKLRRLAFEIAEKNNIKHSFNREKKLAGKAWLYGFLQRKPWIRLRTPEATSLARALGFNKKAVKRFFDNLKEVQKKYNFPPSRIYNQDETGMSTVHVPPKILARKGVKQIGKITTAERGVNITVSCCFNATGTYIPPFFIFPRKNMSSHLLHGAPPESVGHASKSGWMNAELFFKWLQHFAKYAKPTLEDPVLLILDNHCSHISIPAWDFCREKNIIMLSIPPHTSHKLQPLDRTFYKSLKNNYYIECDKSIINNLRRRITEYDVAKIFQVAYEKSATMTKATRGFQCTGIYPFNPEIFSDEDFVVAKAMEVPQPGQSGEASHSAQPSGEAAHSAQPSGEAAHSAQSSGDATHSAQTSGESVYSVQPSGERPVIDESLKELDLSPLNLPRALPSLTNRKRRAQYSEILTSTPIKNKLLDKQKPKKGITTTKRKLNVDKAEKKSKITLTSGKKGTKKKKEKSRDLPNEDFDCLVCGAPYVQPPSEDWIECHKCRGWSHEGCTDGLGTSKGLYECDSCRK